MKCNVILIRVLVILVICMLVLCLVNSSWGLLGNICMLMLVFRLDMLVWLLLRLNQNWLFSFVSWGLVWIVVLSLLIYVCMLVSLLVWLDSGEVMILCICLCVVDGSSLVLVIVFVIVVMLWILCNWILLCVVSFSVVELKLLVMLVSVVSCVVVIILLGSWICVSVLLVVWCGCNVLGQVFVLWVLVICLLYGRMGCCFVVFRFCWEVEDQGQGVFDCVYCGGFEGVELFYELGMSDCVDVVVYCDVIGSYIF